jgi:hypothetical protein
MSKERSGTSQWLAAIFILSSLHGSSLHPASLAGKEERGAVPVWGDIQTMNEQGTIVVGLKDSPEDDEQVRTCEQSTKRSAS